MAYETTAKVLIDMVVTAANAQTTEEKCRVIWRFSDLMWRAVMTGEAEMGIARAVNNEAQDRNFEWVADLWTMEERKVLWPREYELAQKAKGEPNG